jgi:hypothetical protein
MTDKDTKKKILIGARPERRSPATVEEFVTGKEANKRLTIDLPETLHRRAKAGAARDGVFLADLIREFLEQRFPA